MTCHSVPAFGSIISSFAACPSGDDGRAVGRIDRALHDLALVGRQAVRLVHIGCGSGATLIHAVKQARALGFVAIDARGCDPSVDAIVIARWATADWRDPRIGLVFEPGDITGSLAGEEDGGVDLLLCSRRALQDLPPPLRRRAIRTIRRIADRLVLTEEM